MKRTLFIILLAASNFVARSQTTLTLQPDGAIGKDALLHGLTSEANTNYGNADQFPANAWTFSGVAGEVRSAVEFDLTSIPTNAIITSAQLSLYAYDKANVGMGQHAALSGPNDCWLERINSNWNEATVTWNSQPSTSSQNRVSLPASTSPTDDYLNIDVQALLQDMVDNPSTSFGFMLKLQDESYYRKMNFCSSDHANPVLRPKLVVSYIISSDTCITLQPDDSTGKDALLHGLISEINTNYGNAAQFPTNAWTFNGVFGVVKSVVEFDLTSIPANAIISSAQLSLYAWDNPNGGMGQHATLSGANDCWLERITSSWNEATVTWNTQPSSTTQNRVSLPASINPTDDYLNIDVQSLLQDMVDNPTTSFGFMLKLQEESYYRKMNFCSSDHANPALRPKLKVCYSTSNGVGVHEPNGVNVYPSSFPNPAHDFVTIQVNKNQSASCYVITDLLGRILMKGELTLNNTSIDVQALSKGIYILHVGEKNQKSFKIIKD